MNRVMFVFAIALAMGLTIAADAGVPEPDVRLHGLVRLGGVAVEPGRDVTIEARVDGVANPIGRHSFISLDCNSNGILDEEEDPADILAECSRYLLKLRMEAVVSGEPNVDNAARVGDTVDIFVIDAEDLSCDGAEAGASCTDDTDCTGVSCLPRQRLMAKIEMLETGVIRELNLGFCNNGGFDLNLGMITSRLFVDETATGTGDGSSWANAATHLSAALNARICIGPLVSEVWVAGGEFFPTNQTNPADPRSVSFVIPDALKVYGGFAGTESVLEERVLGVSVSILTGDSGIPGNEGDNAYHVVTAD
ncbi:MAG: hypothetical protein IIB61_00505, partial [Planctomycetes bacterium]|nr:hypothetical protein [Planctomycetota bacterium]